MDSKTANQRTIVLVMHLSYGSHRDVLNGVCRGITARDKWRFRVLDYSTWTSGDGLRDVLSDGADGVITTGVDMPVVEDGLCGWSGPAVAAGTPPGPRLARAHGIAHVGFDERAIGRAGADYLFSLGRFRSFGFATSSAKYAASLRCEGFVERLLSRVGPGVPVVPFRTEESESAADPARLAAWLRSMPKPCAVMSNTDVTAAQVLAAAAAARLRVPRDIAIIGCDNDETICETSSPTLTSMAPDHLRLGRKAAEAMRKLLAHPDTPSFYEFVNGVKAVDRQSARPISPAAALAERAEAFIRRGAARGVRVADVVAHLGVSRSLADIRYREVMGETMRDAILRLRLEAVQRKLRETDMAIGQIAASCGFRSEAQARRLFHSRFGCSMREWRKDGGP